MRGALWEHEDTIVRSERAIVRPLVARRLYTDIAISQSSSETTRLTACMTESIIVIWFDIVCVTEGHWVWERKSTHNADTRWCRCCLLHSRILSPPWNKTMDRTVLNNGQENMMICCDRPIDCRSRHDIRQRIAFELHRRRESHITDVSGKKELIKVAGSGMRHWVTRGSQDTLQEVYSEPDIVRS